MLQTLKDRIADLLLPERQRTSDLHRAIDAARTAHVAARRALAIAVAEADRETRRRGALIDDARDLQARALEALAGHRDDLAGRAAEAIAAIETEVAASEAAAVRFDQKVAVARREVDAQRRRLADLDRGRRLASVGTALSGSPPASDGLHPLARAEAALARVEAANADADALRIAFEPPAEKVADDLAEAGFGRPTRVLASDVMTRLRALAAPTECLPEA